MKKTTFLLGILVIQNMLAGTLFKVMHWPGANILLTLGCMLFSFIFLPIALYISYKEQHQYLWLHVITLFVFSIGIQSILFKVLQWDGNQLLLQIAFPLPFILFLPVFLYQTRLNKKLDDTNFLGVLFGLTFIAVFSVLLAMRIG